MCAMMLNKGTLRYDINCCYGCGVYDRDTENGDDKHSPMEVPGRAELH